jgi:hypothetical protein
MINEAMNEAESEAESKTPDARVFWSGDLFRVSRLYLLATLL